MIKKKCKHEWYFSCSLFFEGRTIPKVYQVLHHCKNCGKLKIKAVYRE